MSYLSALIHWAYRRKDSYRYIDFGHEPNSSNKAQSAVLVGVCSSSQVVGFIRCFPLMATAVSDSTSHNVIPWEVHCGRIKSRGVPRQSRGRVKGSCSPLHFPSFYRRVSISPERRRSNNFFSLERFSHERWLTDTKIKSCLQSSRPVGLWPSVLASELWSHLR